MWIYRTAEMFDDDSEEPRLVYDVGYLVGKEFQRVETYEDREYARYQTHYLNGGALRK